MQLVHSQTGYFTTRSLQLLLTEKGLSIAGKGPGIILITIQSDEQATSADP